MLTLPSISYEDSYPGKHSNFLQRFTVSYSIILLIILILGVCFYHVTYKDINEKFWNQRKNILENSVVEMDSSLLAMEALCGQVIKLPYITQLANMPDQSASNFYYLAYQIKNFMEAYVFTQSLLPIDTFYIHLQKIDYLLSSSQFHHMKQYYTGTKSYKADMYNEWYELLTDQSFNETFLSLDRFNSYPEMAASLYLYKIDLNRYTFPDMPATICFEINKEKLYDIFSTIDFTDNTCLFVTDSSGHELFSLSKDDNLTGKSILHYEDFPYQNDFATVNIDGKSMICIRITASHTGWNYYLLQPEADSYPYLRQYRNIYTFGTLIALFSGFFLIWSISKRNARPIIALNNELENEKTEHFNLKISMEKQKPLIQNAYLKRILFGDITSPEELQFACEYLDIKSCDTAFYILSIKIYSSSIYETSAVLDSGIESIISHTEFLHILQKFITSAHYPYRDNERTYYLLIISALEYQDMLLSIQKSVLALHDYLLEHYSLWLYAGFSERETSLMNIWHSHQQANDAIFYTSKNYIFIPYNMLAKKSDMYYYPNDLSAKLQKAVLNGNQSLVREIFELIKKENLSERSLPLLPMQFLLSEIRNTLFKARYSNSSSSPKVSEKLSLLDKYFNCDQSLYNYEELALHLCDIFTTYTTEQQLIDNICNYLKENYRDPSIGLTKISENFNISESYFSFLFKKVKGQNFFNYLEQLRMNASMEYVKQTDCALSDIYLYVGYNNTGSFRRAFKKTFGDTPGNIRKSWLSSQK